MLLSILPVRLGGFFSFLEVVLQRTSSSAIQLPTCSSGWLACLLQPCRTLYSSRAMSRAVQCVEVEVGWGICR